MSYLDEVKEENEAVRERYELAMERIETLLEEDDSSWLWKKENYYYLLYFKNVQKFLKCIKTTYELLESGEIESYSLEVLEEMNHGLYSWITGEGMDGLSYENSFTNPAYAVKQLGKKDGRLLSFIFTELMGLISYAYTRRLFDITIGIELFLEVFGYYHEYNDNTYKEAKSAVYYYVSDYSDVRMEQRIREMLDPDVSFAVELIQNTDFTDLRYLYRFGSYIGKNEMETARYINSLSEEDITKIAATFTQGYQLGFIQNKIDLSKKSTVNIRYHIGFERIVKKAIEQFQEMGLNTTIYGAAWSSIHKRRNLKIGYTSVFPEKQFDYDHRFDNGLYLDKGFVERKLSTLRQAYEKYADLAALYAGPAVMEIFGEVPFEPESKDECVKLSEKQQKLMVHYERESSMITNEYLKGEEVSFTIIAFPIPEIGGQFHEIFKETVKVNTLDMDIYREIHQRLIDSLDQGDYVHVLGSGVNKTNIKVNLMEMEDPTKETIFENCLADVNIPVGEVFTSPVLKGTNGVLHVTHVFLNELEYKNLMLTFKDGMITAFHCTNFEQEEKNKKFLEENLLCQHKTLPIGEFAIGTNTTAYKMGRDFDIQARLPILIAEKTGPHFAVGDTCYKMSEDHKVYNPDGKEIIARDNECSILRKTDMDKAYFNCHTDITIPYDELKEISVVKKDGTRIPIILSGKFVLEGTQWLNKALEE